MCPLALELKDSVLFHHHHGGVVFAPPEQILFSQSSLTLGSTLIHGFVTLVLAGSSKMPSFLGLS